jgi:hypothetical protein
MGNYIKGPVLSIFYVIFLVTFFTLNILGFIV